MDSALIIDKLNYFYVDDWTRRRLHALKDISLEVFSGETFGFLGHNGAGKTSTIKCILDLIRPSSGSIKILGRRHREAQSRALVGYLPEQPYFYDYLTVRETVELFACLSGVKRGDLSESVTRALDLVKLKGRENSRMRSLSKGLTQRVAFAQAIVNRPKLLVLDEPFSGLDPIGRREFRDLLLDLKSQGTTIFMSSHVLSDVEFMCDRVSIMSEGELKGIFSVDSLPQVREGLCVLTVRNAGPLRDRIDSLGAKVTLEGRYSRLEFTDPKLAEAALELAVQRGAGVEGFERRGGSLEDVFLSLVKRDKAN